MKLELRRVQKDADVTIGELYVNGVLECYTLEDPVRPDGIKIPGETAIPFGSYDVTITHSPRFGRPLPLLLDVRNFVGVRIHPGNTVSDTEGCILVGIDKRAKSIGRSRLAFDALFRRLEAAIAANDPITMEVT